MNPSETMNELTVMGRLDRQLNQLKPDARARVLAWLVAKNGAPASAEPKAVLDSSDPPAAVVAPANGAAAKP